MFFNRKRTFDVTAYEAVKGHCSRFLYAAHRALNAEHWNGYDKETTIFFFELQMDTLNKILLIEALFKEYGIACDFADSKQHMNTMTYAKLERFMMQIEEIAEEALAEAQNSSCCPSFFCS